jgi:hypothetical protein
VGKIECLHNQILLLRNHDRYHAFGEAGVVKWNDWPLVRMKKKQGAA